MAVLSHNNISRLGLLVAIYANNELLHVGSHTNRVMRVGQADSAIVKVKTVTILGIAPLVEGHYWYCGVYDTAPSLSVQLDAGKSMQEELITEALIAVPAFHWKISAVIDALVGAAAGAGESLSRYVVAIGAGTYVRPGTIFHHATGPTWHALSKGWDGTLIDPQPVVHKTWYGSIAHARVRASVRMMLTDVLPPSAVRRWGIARAWCALPAPPRQRMFASSSTRGACRRVLTWWWSTSTATTRRC